MPQYMETGTTAGFCLSERREDFKKNAFVNTRHEDMPEARKRMINELYTRAIDPDHR